MNDLNTKCPPESVLSDFGLGKLDAASSETVSQHIETCADCRQRLAGVSGDSFVGRLQQAGGASAAESLVGHQLRDYLLLARLGEGGMGTVYKAVHTHLDKLVAIKLLPPDRTSDPHAVARFRREMKAAGKLAHPNIITAHDAGEAEGRHYLVMEYVEGIDLNELVRRAAPLAVADACELVCQAAVGLDYAHRHGLVHRDIKPSNMMLTADGRVKLLDLGLALLQSAHGSALDLTGAEQQMGTTDYMAPEQATDSHAVDSRADIYSLGCTLYKLLAGHVPFGQPKFKTPTQKMLGHLNAPVPPLVQHRVDLPAGLVATVERMMAKRPEGRFQSAADVAAALAPFAAVSDLPALFATAGRKTAVGRTLGPASPTLASTEIDAPASSHNADTAPYRASAFDGTDGRPQTAVEGASRRAPGISIADQDTRRPSRERSDTGHRGSPRGRLLAAACAGAAVVLIMGAVIVIKMRDGSVRRINVPGEIAELTVKPDDEPVPAPADADREVVRWVFDVGGRVAATNKEEWSWPSKWPERPSELPAAFDDLMILLSDCQKVTDADLKRLAGLTKPFWLNLDRTRISDAGLAALRGLPNLHVITLEQTPITRVGIENLGSLPNLKSIHLVGTATSGADLRILYRFPKLESVQLGRAQLTAEGIETLRALDNVVSVETGGEIELDELNRLADIRQLHYISLVGKSINDACLEPLSKLADLRGLGLWNTSVTDAGLARLPFVAARITFLNVPGSHVTDAGIKHLRGLSKLEFVNLDDTRVTAAGIDDLQTAMPQCKVQWTQRDQGVPVSEADKELASWVLSLGGKVEALDRGLRSTPVDDASGLPNAFHALRIDLENCQELADGDLGRFRSLARPLSLNLSLARITDRGLAELRESPSLQQLRLNGTAIAGAGLDQLGVLPSLDSIELVGTLTTDADLSFLSRFPKLNSVSLGRDHLTDRGATVLSTMPNITSLYCDGAAEAECARIAKLGQLHTLSVGGAQFNDSYIEAFGQLNSLLTLGLYNTSVTAEGAARLPLVAPNVELLILYGPTISDTTLARLSALAARQELKLKRLGLNGCQVGDAGLEKLVALTRLEEIYLKETNVTDAGLKHLRSLANLKLLDLVNTRVTAAGVAELKLALPGCSVER